MTKTFESNIYKDGIGVFHDVNSLGDIIMWLGSYEDEKSIPDKSSRKMIIDIHIEE